METSLVITTTDHLSEDTQVKTLNNINPQASDANLKTFAQMTTALSKDVFVKATRVDTRNLNDDSRTARLGSVAVTNGGGSSTARQSTENLPLTFSVPVSYVSAAISNTIVISYKSDADAANPTFASWLPKNTTNYANKIEWHSTVAGQGVTNAVLVNINVQPVAQTLEGTLLIWADNTFDSLAIPITINITEE